MVICQGRIGVLASAEAHGTLGVGVGAQLGGGEEWMGSPD